MKVWVIYMLNIDGIGTLDKRISILEYADVTDTYGLTKQRLIDAIGNRVWAKIEPARGRTYYEQYKDKVETLHKITIRYRKGLNENMLIRYREKLYRIQSIVDPYEQHVKLEIMCNLKERGDIVDED